jgi:hypothetical protein
LATLYQGKHFVVQHFRASGYVRVIRNTTPFESIEAATSGLDACHSALASVDCKQHGILFDWRNAPLSTAPDLHKALVARIDEIALIFPRRVFLVRTEVGKMQVNRIGRTMSGGVLEIFQDEAQALEFLGRRR